MNEEIPFFFVSLLRCVSLNVNVMTLIVGSPVLWKTSYLRKYTVEVLSKFSFVWLSWQLFRPSSLVLSVLTDGSALSNLKTKIKSNGFIELFKLERDKFFKVKSYVPWEWIMYLTFKKILLQKLQDFCIW